MGGAFRKMRKKRQKKKRKRMSISMPDISGGENNRPGTRRKDRFNFGSTPDMVLHVEAHPEEQDEEEHHETEITNSSDTTRNKLVVVAIDIGSTYSGYAFGFIDCLKNPLSIFSPQWPMDPGFHYKTPTYILLNEDGKCENFGAEAEKKVQSLKEIKGHYIFQCFKMLLYENQVELNQDFKIKDIQGKPIEAITVFAESIQFMVNHAKHELQKRGRDTGDIQDTEIHWILTVPAIWNMKTKQFMRDAAEMAGIPADQLKLALEPEAASIYCRHIGCVEDTDSDTRVQLREGESYVNLDQGGGTIDITVHEVICDNNLKEIYQANGGNWGGNSVNQKFENFILKSFGNEVIQKMKTEHPALYASLLWEFERKKKLFTSNGNTIKIKIDPMFFEIFKQVSSKESHQDIKYVRGMLEVPEDTFKDFFKESIDNILEHLQELFELPKLRNIKTVLAVGGFSESKYLMQKLREKFEDKTFVVPKNAGLAVLKGAVLFGFDPAVVKVRIARYTYGIKVEKDVDKRTEHRYRSFRVRNVQDRKVKLATEIFEKLVCIGDEIVVGKLQQPKEYIPVNPRQSSVKMEFYATEEANPTHVTDDGCIRLGTLDVDLGSNNSQSQRVLELKLDAGNTEISAIVTDKGTRKEYRAQFCLPH